ncbi:flagellar hook-basal body complex protein FliE [Oceanobacillus bengalensis]
MIPLINDASQITINETTNPKKTITPGAAQANFADTLKGAIDNLNDIQMESDKKTQGLASGKVDNLHDVMITSQKAGIALDMTVQVQKKVIDAYNEIMRMQV